MPSPRYYLERFLFAIGVRPSHADTIIGVSLYLLWCAVGFYSFPLWFLLTGAAVLYLIIYDRP